MLKETIEVMESNTTVFHDFESVSMKIDVLKSSLSLLKQLEAVGDLDELLDDLNQWHEMFAPKCEGCHTCTETIPRLRNALDIRETLY